MKPIVKAGFKALSKSGDEIVSGAAKGISKNSDTFTKGITKNSDSFYTSSSKSSWEQFSDQSSLTSKPARIITKKNFPQANNQEDKNKRLSRGDRKLK